MRSFVIGIADTARDDVRALLQAHQTFARSVMPREAVHTLDAQAITDEQITLLGLRENDELLGIGAIRQLEPGHVEIKTMHTTATARRRGVGRALLDHILEVAAAQGATRVSLETGAGDAFRPARSLYTAAGFVPCDAFGEYEASPVNTFLTRSLE